VAPNARASLLAIRAPGHSDDPLGAEPLSGQHRAQADGAITDHGNRTAGADLGADCGVVAGAHDVGQRQQRGDLSRVRARRGDERAVGQRNPHPLALTPVHRQSVLIRFPPEATVLARRGNAVPAVSAGTVADREGGDHEVAGRDRTHVGAGLLHDADELVTDPMWFLSRPHTPVWPQIGAADTAGNDADDRVRGTSQDGVSDLLEADVALPVDERCSHADSW